MDFKEAYKKTMPIFAKTEFAFFKKFNEQEMVNDPICKEPYLNLVKMLMLHLSSKFQLKIGMVWVPAFPDICTILGKTEDPKDFMTGKNLGIAKYAKALRNRFKPYYPAGTKLPGEGGCYVATAVYGSYDCPEVWVLRRYRDNILAASLWGRAFIRCYYAASPTLVKWFGQSRWFRTLWKGHLDELVRNLKAQGVSDKPYVD